MFESSAISALERAAGNLDRLLCRWTEARLAEAESNPDAYTQPEALDTINSAVQTIGRLVAIHKTIEQLKNPSPALNHSIFTRRSFGHSPDRAVSSLPTPATPCVPLVPSIPAAAGSIDEITAKTERLAYEINTLMEANGLPPVEPAKTPDEFGMNFLDAITGREKFPGSGKFFKSIRADLATTPP